MTIRLIFLLVYGNEVNCALVCNAVTAEEITYIVFWLNYIM